MKILYHLLLFSIFFAILFISIKIDTKKKLRVVIITALVLYGLSELSSFLKQEWFPSVPTVMVSENGTRAFRVSDTGQLQTAIINPVIEIKTAQLKDSRNHPNFDSQDYPYLYSIMFSFDIINDIDNKDELVLEEVVAILEVNDGQSWIESQLKYEETILPKSSQNISTVADFPIFLGYNEEIKTCKLIIVCKFENYKDLESAPIELSIN